MERENIEDTIKQNTINKLMVKPILETYKPVEIMIPKLAYKPDINIDIKQLTEKFNKTKLGKTLYIPLNNYKENKQIEEVIIQKPIQFSTGKKIKKKTIKPIFIEGEREIEQQSEEKGEQGIEQEIKKKTTGKKIKKKFIRPIFIENYDQEEEREGEVVEGEQLQVGEGEQLQVGEVERGIEGEGEQLQVGEVERRIEGEGEQLQVGEVERRIEGEGEIKKKTIGKKMKKFIRPIFIEDEDDNEEQIEEEKKEKEEEVIISEKKIKKKQPIQSIDYGSVIEIGDTTLDNRFRQQPLRTIPIEPYFLNSRKYFINFINNLFLPYRDEIEDENKKITCDELMVKKDTFSLLTHQKIIRDYIDLYSPYRGLLLLHGLGSGKTCSSIAIAEGLKTSKKIIVMLPASLRQNYIKEIKKCGDYIYKRNQYWEWISIKDNMNLLKTLSVVLDISEDFILKNKGVFLVNIQKKSNYDMLDSNEKDILEKQIDIMIMNKYNFINYNGLTSNIMKKMTENYTINIFDNSVVIIDEAHNFISRIVNKLSKVKEMKQDNRGEYKTLPLFLSLKLYEMLLRAKNTRIVLLTGTPMINYPNEIGILFNILRGYIKTWTINIETTTTQKIDLDMFQKIFITQKNIDYIDYSPSRKELIITRNPFGFENIISNNTEYNGVKMGIKTKKIYKGDKAEIIMENRGNITDEDFERYIIHKLKEYNIEVIGINITNYKALPDKLDEFISLFSPQDEKKSKIEEPKKRRKVINIEEKKEEEIDINKTYLHITNSNLFKNRIIGLTSYFRSAQEELLPRYDNKVDFHIIKIPMSDYQFNKYEIARQKERLVEKPSKRKKGKVDVNGIYIEPTSTYRIFSRLYCNFVMPNEIGRPLPSKNEEDITEQIKLKDKMDKTQMTDKDIEVMEGDEILENIGDNLYKEQIAQVYEKLKLKSNEFLTLEGLMIYSPKYLEIIENIKNPNHIGLNLIYSQFRTLEGIGILMLALEQNGFIQFKIKKDNKGLWTLDIKDEDLGKPSFALYTGTEDEKEKDILRNIYNGDWYNGDVPQNIVDKLLSINTNNNIGELIKIFMITASGSEGINLKNTRYVHIMEPYWNPVRIEQVIGRARRICSHKDLPIELQSVEAYLYLMTFTKEQLVRDESIELKLKDISKKDLKTPITTDEYLFEIATIKEIYGNQLLRAIKESSIDCLVYNKANSKENLNCLNYGNVNKNAYSYKPDIKKDQLDVEREKNIEVIEWEPDVLNVNGKDYLLRKDTRQIYDYTIFINTKQLIPIGQLTISKSGKYKVTGL